MNRVDVKYVVKKQLLPNLLLSLVNTYRIVQINDKCILQYDTLYYDDEKKSNFLAHQNKKRNRYKLRARHYLDTNTRFFEVKFKNNQGRTFKKRIAIDQVNETQLNQPELGYLQTNYNLKGTNLIAQMWVKYGRITLVHKTQQERITIDLNLTFANKNQTKSYPQLAIIEVKQDKLDRSPMIDLLKKHHQKPGSMSKYCWAICDLYPETKQNNFKPKLLQINKLLQAI